MLQLCITVIPVCPCILQHVTDVLIFYSNALLFPQYVPLCYSNALLLSQYFQYMKTMSYCNASLLPLYVTVCINNELLLPWYVTAMHYCCPTRSQYVSAMHQWPLYVSVCYSNALLLSQFLSPPLIQEGQLSVSGERMSTILVNRLED